MEVERRGRREKQEGQRSKRVVSATRLADEVDRLKVEEPRLVGGCEQAHAGAEARRSAQGSVRCVSEEQGHAEAEEHDHNHAHDDVGGVGAAAAHDGGLRAQQPCAIVVSDAVECLEGDARDEGIAYQHCHDEDRPCRRSIHPREREASSCRWLPRESGEEREERDVEGKHWDAGNGRVELPRQSTPHAVGGVGGGAKEKARARAWALAWVVLE